MIPSLVAVIAGAHESSQQNIAHALLEELKKPGTAQIQKGLPPSVDRLPTLMISHLVPLGPGLPVVREVLRLVTDEQLVPGFQSQSALLSVRAGLHIIHDHVHEGHELAQSAGDSDSDNTAAYWHAIMHRREPDYSNARYWFRHVGSHPIFTDLARDVSELMDDSEFRGPLRCDRLFDNRGRWNAMAFVDLCQECGRDWTDRAQAAARIQEVEMRRLLEHSCWLAYHPGA